MLPMSLPLLAFLSVDCVPVVVGVPNITGVPAMAVVPCFADVPAVPCYLL